MAERRQARSARPAGKRTDASARGGGDERPPRAARGGKRPDAAARGGADEPPARAARSERPAHGRAQPMVLYGRNAVREALRGPRRVARVWASERTARESWLAGGAPVAVVDDVRELERRCGSPDHQGVCAEVAPYRYADAAALLAPADALVVALDELQDPQNLGAIARTAECAGASGLVIPERRSADVTPAVCKASAGAVEHLPVARVRNLADFLVFARDAGAWSYGADAGARTPHTGPDYRGRVVLVLGSEGRGLRPRVAQTCDELVALPLRGRIASLNVGAAAAALLYEVVRQRSAG